MKIKVIHLGNLAVKVVRDYGIVLGFILLCIYFGVTTEEHAFLSISNLLSIPNQVAAITILAIGMTFVIITAGIDLSVGSVLAFIGVVTADLVVRGLNIGLAILAGLALGGFLGAFNGFIITAFRVPPFIMTLAMMTMARGFAFVYTQGKPVFNLPDNFRVIGAGFMGGIPIPVLITVMIIILAYIALTRTGFGRHVYAIGGNEEAARLSGINVNRVKIMVYGISGALAAVSGIILASRLGSGDPKSGPMYELYAIAAVVLGGTSLMGGKGSVLGTLLGAMLIGVLDNGLTLKDVSLYYQYVVKGFVILFAVLLDQLKRE